MPSRGKQPYRDMLLCSLVLTFASALPISAQPKTDAPKSDPAAKPPVAPTPALKDPPAKNDAAGKVEPEIDLVMLLKPEFVFGVRVPSDSIWQVSASAGRQVYRVPMTVKPGSEAMEVHSDTIRIKGGRFLCWEMIDDLELTTAQAPAPVTINLNSGIAPTFDLVAEADDRLPIGVPRFARDLKVGPGKTVSWKMERNLIGGVLLNGQGAYNLKLNKTALEALNPGNPPKIVRDPSQKPADFQKKKLEAEEEYRKKVTVYREVVRQVGKLPDEFKGPMPKTLWALFEVRANPKSLEFEGPAPMPWEISIESLVILQKIADVQQAQQFAIDSATGKASGAGLRAAGTLLASIQGEAPHPFSTRLIAHAITVAGFIGDMQENDAKYKLVEQLLASKDGATIAAITKRLAITPTSASAKLMSKALKDGLMDAASQLKTLDGLITGFQANSKAGAENLLGTTNQFLADPKGPEPRKIFETLLDASKKNEELRQAVQTGIDFDSIPETRLDSVLAATIEAAPTEPVAAEWLNNMLGVKDAGRLLRVVSALNATKLEEADAGTPAAPATPGATGAPAGATGAESKPTITGALGALIGGRKTGTVITSRIPIRSITHNIFAAAQNSNAQIRALAWLGTRHFVMDEAKMTPDDKAKWPRQIVDIAIAQSPTPVPPVLFLARHEGPATGDAVAQFLVRADNDASIAAAKALLGSKREIDQVLVRLGNETDRHNFGIRFYENITTVAPYAVGLLRDKSDGAPALKWFGRQLQAGVLPDPAEWDLAFGSVDRVIEFVPAGDENLALGAVGALVAGAGGGDVDVPKVAAALRANKSATVPELIKLWADQRAPLFAQRLKRTDGKFDVVLTSAPEPREEKTPPTWTSATVGQAVVKVEGSKVTIGNVGATIPADGNLVIQLNAADLKKLPGEAGKFLGGYNKAIDLRPLSNGGWRASLNMGDGRLAKLTLVPAK